MDQTLFGWPKSKHCKHGKQSNVRFVVAIFIFPQEGKLRIHSFKYFSFFDHLLFCLSFADSVLLLEDLENPGARNTDVIKWVIKWVSLFHFLFVKAQCSLFVKVDRFTYVTKCYNIGRSKYLKHKKIYLYKKIYMISSKVMAMWASQFWLPVQWWSSISKDLLPARLPQSYQIIVCSWTPILLFF